MRQIQHSRAAGIDQPCRCRRQLMPAGTTSSAWCSAVRQLSAGEHPSRREELDHQVALVGEERRRTRRRRGRDLRRRWHRRSRARPRCCVMPLPGTSSKKLPGTTVDMLRITLPSRGERAIANSVRRKTSFVSWSSCGVAAAASASCAARSRARESGRRARHRAAGREPVDQTQQLVVIAQRVLVEAVHERAAVRRDREPPLAVERDDRLAHRDAAHPQLARDVVLVDPVTLAELAVEDQRPHMDRHQVAAAGPVDERHRREAGASPRSSSRPRVYVMRPGPVGRLRRPPLRSAVPAPRVRRSRTRPARCRCRPRDTRTSHPVRARCG